MSERAWEIYTLSDPRNGGVRYVGVTFRGKRRYNEHLSRAITGGKTHRDYWIRSLITVGVRPTYNVIERGAGDGWQDAERRWIATYRAITELTNLSDGGEGLPGYVPTPELRRKWSQMRLGTKYAPGRIPAMLGKTHTPEAREKIRRAGTGRSHSTETRQKLSMQKKGKPLPTSAVEKSAASRRGKPLSAEHRHRIAATTTNRKSVVCVETGQVFASITEAAHFFGVSEAGVNQAIRKGCRCKGNHLRFA